MGFFIYSNTLESHLINLRSQDNLKTQKMRKSQSRSIYITYILCSWFKYFKYLKICLISHQGSHGVMVSTTDFWSAGPWFESRPWQDLFLFFFNQNARQDLKNLWWSKPVRTARVELEILHFSPWDHAFAIRHVQTQLRLLLGLK